MNAEEKKILYKFFKTAYAYISDVGMEEDEPVFFDDIVTEQKEIYPVQSLKQIYEQVSECSACRLCKTRKNVVPGEGPAELNNFPVDSDEYLAALSGIEVMVIGEGPGADEDAQGRPFVGKAGQLLDKMLAAINLFRNTNCYIANVVKCRPPNNRDPLPDETAACRNFLDSQIKIIKPKALLIVGRVALQNLLPISGGIGKMHGQFLEYTGIPVMATYHPSALLRDVNLKRPAWEDLKLFRAKLDEITNKKKEL